MKVESPYRYLLPCNVTLEKGVSEVGEIQEAAKKHLDKLIAAGIVKVLNTTNVADPEPATKGEAPKPQTSQSTKLEPEIAPGSIQSLRVEGRFVVDEPAKPTSSNAEPVEVTPKRRKKE